MIVTVPGYRQHSWHDVFTPFARYMTNRGWDVALLETPHHFSRRTNPFEHGELLVNPDPATTLRGFRQGVLDVRKTLATFQAAGSPRVSLLGTSLGGLLSALTSIVDDSHHRLVLLEPVLDPVDAVWNCRLLTSHRTAVRRLGYTECDVRRFMAPLRAMNYSLQLPADRVLILNPRHDLIARRDVIMQACERWGHPEQIEMAAGHFLFAVLCYQLLPRVRTFLEADNT